MPPAATPLERVQAKLRDACHGAGAGASVGLVRSIFKHFDRDGDGTITKDELENGLLAYGIDVEPDELSAALYAVDINGDGRVGLAETVCVEDEMRGLAVGHHRGAGTGRELRVVERGDAVEAEVVRRAHGVGLPLEHIAKEGPSLLCGAERLVGPGAERLEAPLGVDREA